MQGCRAEQLGSQFKFWGEDTGRWPRLATPGSQPGPRVASLPKNRPVLTMGRGQKICAAVGIVSGWLENTTNLLLKFVESGQKKGKLYLAQKLIPGQECIAGMHLCVQYAGKRKVPEVQRPLPSMMDRPEIQGKWKIVLSELSD